jgi:hypothetical protein
VGVRVAVGVLVVLGYVLELFVAELAVERPKDGRNSRLENGLAGGVFLWAFLILKILVNGGVAYMVSSTNLKLELLILGPTSELLRVQLTPLGNGRLYHLDVLGVLA